MSINSNQVTMKALLLKFLKMREIGALIPLVVIFVIASFSNPAFTSLPNLLNMLRASSYIFIAGVGMTYVLCGRGLDLSIGSQVGMSGVVLGALMVWWNVPTVLAVFIALLVGALAGAINGIFVVVLRVVVVVITIPYLQLL